MTRLESSVWPLAGGSATVFALAVVLGRVPWQVAFGVVALAVAGWASLGPFVVGAPIGGVAWLCVTGFDVHHFGVIKITGLDDAARAAVLVFVGLVFGGVHAFAEAYRSRHVRPDPVWAEFLATEQPRKPPADVTARPPVTPAAPGTQAAPGTPTRATPAAPGSNGRPPARSPHIPEKEPSDG